MCVTVASLMKIVDESVPPLLKVHDVSMAPLLEVHEKLKNETHVEAGAFCTI